MIKPDWNIFKAKYSDNPEKNFEWLCYLLFCKEHDKNTGISGYKNQAAIETDPINCGVEVIGWQSKFYTTTLASNKDALLNMLINAKTKYSSITKVIFYTNQMWGQGRKGGDPLAKIEVEKKARELGVEIEWRGASYFESPFVVLDNKEIVEEFFCLDSKIDDKMIVSRIQELNLEYREKFQSINDNFLLRKETNLCIERINEGLSVILHGKAGSGKSGCTQGIASYCEEKSIPYVAIKLDDRIPKGSSDAWGKELGLSASISNCIDLLAKNEKAVIILDQLDALRWTRSHSRESLSVCSEIIREIAKINDTREKNISVVFVCRTYDLDSDNKIKNLLKPSDEHRKSLDFEKVLVSELDSETVAKIVGEKYFHFPLKMKNLLRVPNNLYIWSQLDTGDGGSFYTLNELIFEWWKQLQRKCFEVDIEAKSIVEVKDNLVEHFNRSGELHVNKRIFSADQNVLDFLITNGIIVADSNKISFVHQSLADYFLVERMFIDYSNGTNVIEMVGGKEEQTPNKRYQIQMLLQLIEEDNQVQFIKIGEEFLRSPKLRFYFKHLFLEVLGQCSKLETATKGFILENCDDSELSYHLIESVIIGRKPFIELLLNEGVMGRWFDSSEKRELVYRLIKSIRTDLDVSFVNFIRERSLKSKEVDAKFLECFHHKIFEDSNEAFELRMEFYRKYPELIGVRIDFNKLFQKNEIRATRLLDLLLFHKSDVDKRKRIRNFDDFLYETNDVLIKNYGEILKLLLKHVPKDKEHYFFSDWAVRSKDTKTLERLCIAIIKKANSSLIKENPRVFLDRYSADFEEGYTLFNEIILSGLIEVPNEFSDDVIMLILSNFNACLFDKTSENEDKLALAKDIMKKHAEHCNDDIFVELEKKITHFVDDDAKERYRNRIEANKTNKFGKKVDWSFWGDLQHELLPCLPIERRSTQAVGLIKVLDRRFCDKESRYFLPNTGIYNVKSPIHGKELSSKQWKKIIESKKIGERTEFRRIECEDGSYTIDDSLESFSRQFGSSVSSNPNRFIQLVLQSHVIIDVEYIESLFSSVAYSQKLQEVPNSLLEEMILKFRYDYSSQRAGYICEIVGRKKEANWSQPVIDMIKDIALNQTNPRVNQTSLDDTEMKTVDSIQSNAINCVRGKAAGCIAKLLCNNQSLFNDFKEVIDKLLDDVNVAVRFSGLLPLYPVYQFDKSWSAERFIKAFESDIRFAGECGAKPMFFLLYPNHKDQVLEIILKCYGSEDKGLISVGSHCLCEMFLLENEFEEIILNVKNMSEEQVDGILRISMLYLEKGEYIDKVKRLISHILACDYNLEHCLSNIFYRNLVDLERDRDFIVNIVESKSSWKIIHAFLHYLKKKGDSLVLYSDIILTLSATAIKSIEKDQGDFWFYEDLPELIMGLYDETTKASCEETRIISQKCLGIWDAMFENHIGSIRLLSKKIIDQL